VKTVGLIGGMSWVIPVPPGTCENQHRLSFLAAYGE
jgi:hypothetical protein